MYVSYGILVHMCVCNRYMCAGSTFTLSALCVFMCLRPLGSWQSPTPVPSRAWLSWARVYRTLALEGALLRPTPHDPAEEVEALTFHLSELQFFLSSSLAVECLPGLLESP